MTFLQLTSLNEMALSIGFNPGVITDTYGNYLTVNTITSNVTDLTLINQGTIAQSQAVSNSTSYISWIMLSVLLLFFMKGGYPVLLSI